MEHPHENLVPPPSPEAWAEVQALTRLGFHFVLSWRPLHRLENRTELLWYAGFLTDDFHSVGDYARTPTDAVLKAAAQARQTLTPDRSPA